MKSKSDRSVRTRAFLAATAILVSILVSATQVSAQSSPEFTCNTGGLDQDTCEINKAQNINGLTIETSDTDIIVNSGGRLYTDHAFSGTGSSNVAKINIQNGDFIVKNGGVVHGNVNISAFNIKVGQDGIIDASGLGYQSVPGKKSNCPTVETQSGFCTGYGPGGGGGGGSNSGTGSGGGAHAGKGGSYDDSGNSFASSGGGRGPVKSSTYGRSEKPVTFGSAGGSFGSTPPNTFFLKEAESTGPDDSSSKLNVGNAFQYGGERTKTIKEASSGFRVSEQLGKQDDPSHDLADSDRWHPSNKEYRSNNPYDITMGSGGGRLILVANNKLNNSGYILSNGLDGMGTGNNGYPGSGGAGGTVSISAGGIFGEGSIRADGGDYAEFMDGGESNTGKAGVSAGGGGGYVYYQFSISQQNWDITADEGSGTVGMDTDFSGNSNKQNQESRDLVATNGSIASVIAFSANVNETILNSGETFAINGTAGGSFANVTLNGTQVGSKRPNQSDGAYKINIDALDIGQAEGFRNYTLTVSSTISGNTISNVFNLSHRKIEIQNQPDYLLKPGQDLSISGRSKLLRDNKTDQTESVETDYTGGFEFRLLNQSTVKALKTVPTDGGTYSLNQQVQPTPGLKTYNITAENQNGIKGGDTKQIGWIDINDTVLDPGDPVRINGSLHNSASIYVETPSGNFLQRDQINPGSNGYFNENRVLLNRSQITDFSDLGNYTVTFETNLNGQERNESFEVSYREIEIDHSTDFLLTPSERFNVQASANKTLDQTGGGTRTIPYSGQNITFSFFNGESQLNQSRVETNAQGNTSATDTIVSEPGKKFYTLQTVNQNGISDTVNDNDLVNTERKNLGLVTIDDRIVNSNQAIQVTGSAYNNLNITVNGSKAAASPVKPNSTNNQFESTVFAPDIQDTGQFGNKTLTVETNLNGETRTEQFEISVRGIRMQLDKQYPIEVEPGENFTVSGEATKFLEDGSGGSTTETYEVGEEIKIVYADQNGIIQKREVPARSGGSFSAEFTSKQNAGDREIRISTENPQGIERTRSETVETQIKVQNSSSVSPSLRFFKDFSLDKTRFINPSQNVTFSVDTRKSLDFVNEVYANVTLPNGSKKQVELNVQNALGQTVGSEQEIDQGQKQRIATSQVYSPKQLRIGYGPRPEDKLSLFLPFEKPLDQVEDLSPKNHDITINDQIVLGERPGVFSTNTVEFDGGSFAVDNQSALNFITPFTTSAWIKTGTSPGVIYSKSTDNTNKIRELRVTEQGKAAFQIQGPGTGDTAISETTVDTGEWYHVIGEYNGTHAVIYVNGQLEAAEPVSLDLEKFQRKPRIGISGTFSDRKYQGKIDQLKVFNKSLSDSRIDTLSSQTGSFTSPNITTDADVKEILKLLNFNIEFNNQKINATVLSDPDSDNRFEQSTPDIPIDGSRRIESVPPLSNFSDTFKLRLELITQSPAESPVVSSIDLKARKNDKLLWKQSKSVDRFFDNQFGTYQVRYGAEDLSGNIQDELLETSNFSVRDIKLDTQIENDVSPGQTITISGNATAVTGNGSGGRSTQPFTEQISLIYNTTLKGQNQIEESLPLQNLRTGQTRRVPVNGTQTPQNTSVTFIGEFFGTDEILQWSGPQDWDSARQRTGTVHSSKEGSSKNNNTLTIGYPSNSGNQPLEAYYHMDDSSGQLTDANGSNNLQPVSKPAFQQPGILSTRSVRFNGTTGFKGGRTIDSSSFSVNAYVNIDSLPEGQGGIGNTEDNTYTVFGVGNKFTVQITDAGNVYSEIAKNGESYNVTTSGGDVQPGQWTMITARYDRDSGDLTVETGLGSTSPNAVTLPSGQRQVNLDNTTYVGYRPDINANGFKGRIDELRLYSDTINAFTVRQRAGDLTTQQSLKTDYKSFSETVRPGSLVLKAEKQLRGQEARIKVVGEAGGVTKSDTIQLVPGKDRYEITGNLFESKNWSVEAELDSNLTNAPSIQNLTLIRRFATEDPSVDIDQDGSAEAQFNGRLIEGRTETVNLNNLSKGTNTASFDAQNGRFRARINYTEILRNTSQQPVNIDTDGEFSTEVKAVNSSRRQKISLFSTSSRGIRSFGQETITTGLVINSSSVKDSDDDDRILQTSENLRINATFAPHKNSIDTVTANITAPNNQTFVKTLNKVQTNLFEVAATPQNLSSNQGQYKISLAANDSQGITQVAKPKLAFNVTEGKVTASTNDTVVGLQRKFKVSGKVEQTFGQKPVNSTVTLTLPETGQQVTTQTSNSGQYSAELTAPDKKGTHTINVESADENNISAQNSTQISVDNTTEVSVEIPSKRKINGVTLDEGLIRNFTINITNTGQTRAEDLVVFGQDLPTPEKYPDRILESEGGRPWKTFNRSYDIPAGTTRTVEASVNVSQASLRRDYEVNISTEFTTTGGTTKTTEQQMIGEVTLSSIPLFQQNETVTVEDGFSGNFIPPNDASAIAIKNDGTGVARSVGWAVQNPLFNQTWIDSFEAPKNDPDRVLPSSEAIGIFAINGQVPEGTPPGTYSTKLESKAQEPDQTNTATFTVNVQNSPKYEVQITPLKSKVEVPPEINQSNPVDLGQLRKDQAETDLFNMTLKNTGNRDFTIETRTDASTNDDNNIFYQNQSNTPGHGVETFQSTISPEQNNQYAIDSPTATVGYVTRFSDNVPEQYTANISIECTSPNNCQPQTQQIPLEATVVNPPPRVRDVEIPSIVGTNRQVTINGTVVDEQGTQNFEGVQSLNATLVKYLDTKEKQEFIGAADGSEDFSINGRTGEFSITTTPTKLGRTLSQNDHTYSIRFNTSDVDGNSKVTKSYNFTVRDKASVEAQVINQGTLELQNITSTSGTKQNFTVKAVGGDIKAEQVTLSASVPRVNLNTADANNVNVTSRTRSISVGTLQPGENAAFNITVESRPRISPTPRYTSEVQASWNNPDATTGTSSIAEKPISALANPGMQVSGTQALTVTHGQTQQGFIRVNSTGNVALDSVNLQCFGCTQQLGITSFEEQSFNVDPGEVRDIQYNLTADRFIPSSSSGRIDIEAASTRRTEFLNDTLVSVPDDRAIELSPGNQTQVIPVDRGVINVTEIKASNTGNVEIDPVELSTSRDKLFLGDSELEEYSQTIPPGQNRTIEVRSNTEGLETGEFNTSIDPSISNTLDRSQPANIRLFIQDFNIGVESQNQTLDIISSDRIRTVLNLTRDEQSITPSANPDVTLETAGREIDIPESYNPSTQLWTSTFEAPQIQDGVNHTYTYRLTTENTRIGVSDSQEVEYADITPPQTQSFEAEPVQANQNSTIDATLRDKSNIDAASVRIRKPDGSTKLIQLQEQSDSNLSQTSQKTFKANLTETSQEGLYKANLTVRDTAQNTNFEPVDFFRVFKPLNVTGEAGNPEPETQIELLNSGGDPASVIDPNGSEYNSTIKSGNYTRADISLSPEAATTVRDVNAEKISEDPPKFDSNINQNLVQTETEYLTGFAINSKAFENTSGTIGFNYSDYVRTIDFQGNLQVLKCQEYNISRASPCVSGYEPVNKNKTGINIRKSTAVVSDIEGFSSYILVENTSTSSDENLNVNLTGNLDGFDSLENLSELSNLDSLLQQVANNTENLSDVNASAFQQPSSDDDGGGGSSTGLTNDTREDLESVAEQLNQTINTSEQESLAIGNKQISVSVQPGETKTSAISVQNPGDEQQELELQATSNIRSIVDFEQQIDLEPREFRTVRIDVNATNQSQLKEFSGFIRIESEEVQRSIPVNIDIVGAENRLLDVTLDPTVESFQPDGTARLRISFSNQGFSRAVDAVTDVKIVDVTEDEVVAQKTSTFAVQTTLDKIVTLELPSDTDLGTYEARANVEYANVPGNRSATAVGQLEIQKPFLQRETFGIKNSFILIGFGVLVLASIAGGYYYYRKKKLEAKRSRFEEQVDNDKIPSESGRTAFVGELSEIGTRAFINLDDLMTHCLVAGATGAGKSVAAQVIVEEALEQGINVIVLDPTGQWSGYLDKNEDDEFFAFYDDFGMKEGDARSYEGNIRAVDAEQDTIDIIDVLRPEGDEGSINIFSMHKLENAELEEYLSDTIQQIFDYNPEEKDQLKTLICYDEAHRVLPKFGGEGRGVKMLERGAREFRKWGTGMLMISQVIDDFPEEVRANIGTQIQMRTEYEGDLDRIERKYGNNISQGVTKSDTGTGMVQNSSYNHGRPYFVDFRPIKHSPERLSDEELDKFEKYNRRVDEIEDMIAILEEDGEDVFEYKSQLKLVKKNIRKRSFNLVDTYLDELEEDLNDKLGL